MTMIDFILGIVWGAIFIGARAYIDQSFFK
jgi:hypothetical protein